MWRTRFNRSTHAIVATGEGQRRLRILPHQWKHPAETRCGAEGAEKPPTVVAMRDISIKIHSDQEAHHTEQDRRCGDKRHHEEKLHDFVVIEPAVEAAVHVRRIVVSLWPAYAAPEVTLVVTVAVMPMTKAATARAEASRSPGEENPTKEVGPGPIPALEGSPAPAVADRVQRSTQRTH
jgi:hypothetical protein